MMNEINELIEKLTELLEQDKFLDNKFEHESSDKPVYPKLFFFNDK